MRSFQPSSFLKLLLISFALAVLPLLWAFTNANIEFGKLAKQSENTISRAVESTRLINELQEQLSLMERSARQYYVLGDTLLLNNFGHANQQFNQAITRLKSLIGNAALQHQIADLDKKLKTLSLLVIKQQNQTVNDMAFLDTFSELTQQTERIMIENNREIDRESLRLTLTAKQTQKTLFLQSLILVPLALLMAGFVTALLVRPLRHMDSAIHNLGKGEYEVPITIKGPGDLRLLGKRLDWLRKELKSLDAQKHQFLRHVSHELKTPLTAIREATELLRDGIGGPLSRQQSEIISILHDNSIRLQKMIENLLNYNKLVSIQSQSNLQSFNMAQLFEKVIQSHALSIQNKSLTVESDYEPSLSFVGDEEKMTIILDNLISNAVKYTPPFGHVKLSAYQQKDVLHMIVSDDGPGFTKQESDQIFDTFYQGDNLHQGIIKGSGVGLTIVKDLIETLGGSISLNHLKKGAHFHLNLPCPTADTKDA